MVDQPVKHHGVAGYSSRQWIRLAAPAALPPCVRADRGRRAARRANPCRTVLELPEDQARAAFGGRGRRSLKELGSQTAAAANAHACVDAGAVAVVSVKL